MPALDLSRLEMPAHHLQTLTNLLAQHVPNADVWAYGSRVTGGAHEGSDLDLVLRNPTDLTQDVEGWYELKEALQESTLPILVEVHLWSRLPQAFHRNIEAGYVVVQVGNKGLGMGSEWRNVALGDVCQLRAGSVFPPALQGKPVGNYPFVKVSDMNLAANVVQIQNANNWVDDEDLRQIKGKPFPPGTTVFAKIGEALKANRLRYIIRPTIIDNNMMGAIPASDIADSRFFHYALSKFDFGEVAGGSALPYLTVSALSKLEIPIPPLYEQRAIAHILGTIDDKIELNRKQNETLEAMARALFKAWFVDFEPVRAKMKGRWQRGQSLPGLPAHLYDLFPNRLVESELGEIPEGWRMGSLGEVAVHPRRSVQPSEIKDETPYIALEHMPKRSIALAEWGVANGLESNKYEFKHGEILFGKLRPYFHKVGVAPINGVCSTDIVVIAPKLPEWFGFVLAHSSSDAFVEYTNAGSTGTKMPRTSWSEMARYKVALPHESIAAEFNQHIKAASNEITTKIHESKSLAQLRDTLLPKLISGELRVPDAEFFAKKRGL